MVERQTKDYAWQFAYLGANVDAFAEASAIGITRSATADFAPTKHGVAGVFQVASANLMSYRSGGGYTLTDEQRKKMGKTAQ